MHDFLLVGIAPAAFVSTAAGGLLAVQFSDRLHFVMAFSAGAIISVAFFDLLPEALELGVPALGSHAITGATALGFFSYVVIDRLILIYGPHLARGATMAAPRLRGAMAAGYLSTHSFLDGLAIGLAFQASEAVGAVVTIAIIGHDCSDGMNTVNLILKNQGSRKTALRWLLADASMPALGIAASQFIELSPDALSLVLALFAGFFLYIGASDLLPESHHAHPRVLTTVATLIGATALFLVIHVAE